MTSRRHGRRRSSSLFGCGSHRHSRRGCGPGSGGGALALVGCHGGRGGGGKDFGGCRGGGCGGSGGGRSLGRRQFWLGGCGCDQFLVHYGGLMWLLWHVPTIRWVVVLYLVLAYYWWYRVAHCEINRSMIASHPGTHPPTLVARDKQTKEALAQRLWGWAASPIGLTSWIFHVLVLQQEQFYDKVFSMTCYWYQQINCQYNGQTSDFIKRVHLGQFILETSLVLYFTEVRGTEVLYFDFGSVAYQHPNGLLTRYEHLTALVDPKTSVAMIYHGDPKDSKIHDTPLPVSEAAFVLMFFWSTGAHVPAHMYGTWVSRIPESQRDDVVFWMHQCSNAMIVESRSWVPTFTTNVNHYWSVPSATSHTRVLDFNSRPVMKHSALRSNELLGASRLCQFMVALRATVFRVFEKHKVRYDPELLLATIFHSLDHYGAWVHRIPSCYKYDNVDYHHFWETQVRGSHCLLVDNRHADEDSASEISTRDLREHVASRSLASRGDALCHFVVKVPVSVTTRTTAPLSVLVVIIISLILGVFLLGTFIEFSACRRT